MIGTGRGTTSSFFFFRASFVRKSAFIIFFLSTAKAWDSSTTIGLKSKRHKAKKLNNTLQSIAGFYFSFLSVAFLISISLTFIIVILL
ncbi:hypothetical protein X975_01043, partial [Stegodyphus mimosarum]